MRRIYLLILLVVMATGCKHTQPVVLPRANVEFRDSVSIHFDFILDTTIIEHYRNTYRSGDSIVITDSTRVEKTHYRDKADTVFTTLYDSVFVPVEVPVGQIKGRRFLRNSGIALWCILGVLLMAVIVGIIFKFAK